MGRGEFISFQSHALLNVVMKLCMLLIHPAWHESVVLSADPRCIIHLPVTSLVTLWVGRLDMVLSIPVPVFK